jgi:hypothetical protein
MFLSGVSGLDWTTYAHCSRSVLPARSRRRIADADTFFGIELPSLTGGQKALADLRLHFVGPAGLELATNGL